MTATTIQKVQQEAAPAVISLHDAIDQWATTLLTLMVSTANDSQSGIDQLPPGDVLSALQDIRIDARTGTLPRSLAALLQDVKSRVKDVEKGRPAINFNVKGLLRTIDEGVAQLA